MWHLPKEGDPPGQRKQFIRICMSCHFIYFGFGNKQQECPKCTWPSYGAPFVYNGWLKAIWHWITQSEYKEIQIAKKQKEDQNHVRQLQ